MPAKLKLTYALVEQIVELKHDGPCDAGIIAAIGVHQATFYRWLKEGEDAKTGVKRTLCEIQIDRGPVQEMPTHDHQVGGREPGAVLDGEGGGEALLQHLARFRLPADTVGHRGARAGGRLPLPRFPMEITYTPTGLRGSSYFDVIETHPDWLGSPFVEEAEYLRDTPDSKVQMNVWRRELGIRVHAARKARMRRLSYEWLAGLREIVIDPERCPLTFSEFTLKEFEKDKEGNWIDEIPDGNDHSIDAVRYAMMDDVLRG